MNAQGVDERMINVHYYYYVLISVTVFAGFPKWLRSNRRMSRTALDSYSGGSTGEGRRTVSRLYVAR